MKDAPVIAGYSMVRPIGAGGFARVYLYEQDFPRRQVAVKVMERALSHQAQEMFFNEVNTLALLSGHSNIVSLYAAGLTLDTRPYITMEMGSYTLAEYVQTSLFSREKAVDIVLKIASALSYAHKNQILHRDVKPSNILFNHFGEPLLTDFGIAAVGDPERAPEAMSTKYAAPEVLNGKTRGSQASEVYSLARTMCVVLGNITLPNEMLGILRKALSKNPAHRFATVAQFGEALSPFGHDQQLASLL